MSVLIPLTATVHVLETTSSEECFFDAQEMLCEELLIRILLMITIFSVVYNVLYRGMHSYHQLSHLSFTDLHQSSYNYSHISHRSCQCITQNSFIQMSRSNYPWMWLAARQFRYRQCVQSLHPGEKMWKSQYGLRSFLSPISCCPIGLCVSFTA